MSDVNNKKLAIIGIVVENRNSIKKLNEILSDYSECIIGRMGLPRKDVGVNLISIYVEAEHNVISAMSGKLGMLDGVSSKVIIAKSELQVH